MKQEYSAGGVVFRKNNESKGIEILIAQHSLHHGWIFPKGHIADTIKNESKEEAALREVKEETGIDGKIIQPLRPIEYAFEKGEERIHKTVYYFLMEYLSGDSSIRDHEMEQVEWLPSEEVANRLTYESDTSVWEEAQTLIKK